MLRDSTNDHNLQPVFWQLLPSDLAALAQTSKSWQNAMTEARAKKTTVTLSRSDSDLALQVVSRFYPALVSINVSGAHVTDVGMLALIRSCPMLTNVNTSCCPRTPPFGHPLRRKQHKESDRINWWASGLSKKFNEPEISIWRVARVPKRGYLTNRTSTVRVRVLTNEEEGEITCEWNETTTFKELIRSFYKKRFPNARASDMQGTKYFTYNRDRLLDNDTPAMRCISDGDMLRAYVPYPQRRMRGLGKGSIGVWEVATGSNVVLLDEPALKAGDVDLPAILANVHGTAARKKENFKRQAKMLSPSQCAELVEHTECAFARSDQTVDFKFDMSISSLRAIIGDVAVSSILSFGQSILPRGSLFAPRFILRRRTVAVGECVPFHHDSAAVVVNIALNDGFCGGNLVCVVANQVVLPDRPAGCATAHNSAIVHGVTEIRAGVRYNLFCEFK